ncbi:MAG: recombinase family protein [Pseudomonadota bacterium]
MKERRCAVYTRKSSEEGLELQFNSLHAQREACEAYILSQAGEGWHCLPQAFDDGGVSGGHLERPGLQALIEDVKAGLVDVIIVYKVDRLTRSLADFSKLVEIFDQHDVSFVSVTQAFNTTNSMGRLTLNVLLSFAQFEREVTGERIRDKIALSRKRGLWTGGLPPLGYDVVDKKLVINEGEAEQVLHIFERYLQLKTVRLLQDELTRDGYLSKRRITKTGQATGGKPFERGALYSLLKNRTYLGLTTHKGESFDGEHEAILEKELFDRVQRILTSNRRTSRLRAKAKHRSLLAGKIRTPEGHLLTPSHVKRGSRRYRYYVEPRHTGEPSLNRRPIRLPAPEIESVICNALADYLTDTRQLVKVLGDAVISPDQLEQIEPKAATLAERLRAAVRSSDIEDVIISIIETITLILDDGSPIGLDVSLDLTVLAAQLGIAVSDLGQTTLTVEAHLKVCNNGKKIIVGNKTKPANPNPTLIRTLRLAHKLKALHLAARPLSISEIAANQNLDKRHVWRILRLAFLAPDIQIAILNGRQPRDMLQKDLIYPALPYCWKRQRILLGFPPL